jgi:uncharacterized protein (UPF0212 family)
MDRLNRVLDIDLATCPRCGAEVRIIATITEPALIARILQHVQQRPCHERAPRAPPSSLVS